MPWLDEVVQAKRPRRLLVVLTPSEVRELLLHVDGTAGLVAQLLYGTGMRRMEAVRLRVKDVEFARREIIVREGKGSKGSHHGAAREPDGPLAGAVAKSAGLA